ADARGRAPAVALARPPPPALLPARRGQLPADKQLRPIRPALVVIVAGAQAGLGRVSPRSPLDFVLIHWPPVERGRAAPEDLAFLGGDVRQLMQRGAAVVEVEPACLVDLRGRSGGDGI